MKTTVIDKYILLYNRIYSARFYVVMWQQILYFRQNLLIHALFLFRVFYNFHAFIMNNFRHRVLRIESNNAAVQKGAPSERNDSACMMLTKDVWLEALVLLQVTAPAIGKQGSVERAFIRLLPRTLVLFLNKLFSER